MKRRVSAGYFYREPCPMRMGKGRSAEHGLGAAYREYSTEYCTGILGYDGSARNSDRVSVDHFPPVLDKAHTVRYG
jgi:hypothetical protein